MHGISPPIQPLKQLFGVIFLGNSLQSRKTLPLAIQTQCLLPRTRIAKEDEWVIQSRGFGLGVDCCGEVLQEEVDVGSEEHCYLERNHKLVLLTFPMGGRGNFGGCAGRCR